VCCLTFLLVCAAVIILCSKHAAIVASMCGLLLRADFELSY
jgi:hypothetical protein